MKSKGNSRHGIRFERIVHDGTTERRLIDGYIAKRAGVATAAKRRSSKAARRASKLALKYA